jgi:ATP phosphoribosyltransferase
MTSAVVEAKVEAEEAEAVVDLWSTGSTETPES